MKRYIFFLLLVFPLLISAQESPGVDITPHIIDEKGMAGEIFNYNITLINNTDRLKNLYAFVNDLTIEEGRQEFTSPGKMDKTLSLARWVTIKRSVVDLKPGGSIEIPLDIKINQYAKPGKYYAKVVFGDGSNRPNAENQSLSGSAPEIMININVEELVVEKSQVHQFKTSKNIFLQKPVDFIVDIENFGNRAITPGGAIYIQNRRGQEIEKLDFNSNGDSIPSEEKKSFNISWEDVRGFGKFKAKLEIEYGDQIRRDLQDATTFWVLPLPILIGFVAGLLFLVVILTYIIYKKTYQPSYHTQNAIKGSNGVIDLKSKK